MMTSDSSDHNPRFLIIDVEATCWKDRSDARTEIIEIGAVIFEAGAGVMGEFQTFIKPFLYPTLSEFCTDLTTITQSDVDDAPPFPEALAALVSWADPFQTAIFASWGDYDRKQFVRDCELHDIPYPLPPEHVNLKKAFARLQGKRPMGMARALRALGIALGGTHHRGIDDARNITRILEHMLQADAVGLLPRWSEHGNANCRD